MAVPTVQIDTTRCVHCGQCIRDCLAKILVASASGIPEFVPGGSSRCFACQHCLAVCPTGAFSWSGKKPEDAWVPGKEPSPETMINLLRQRRSIRQYKRENVEQSIIDQLHAAMAFVPTGCNDHRLFFSYSDDLKTTDYIRKAASDSVLNMIASGTLPRQIAHFAAMKPALELGIDIYFRGAPHFVAIAVPPESKDAHIDPYIAATQFELLAHCFGLGTCWGGMATDLFLADDVLRRRLNIPETHALKMIILFGRGAVRYARCPMPEPCRRAEVL
ncbi:MAG: nitroreductase family protein [Thermoguttaceae bacterium]|nr:nitroreductase family protein [Thermoguttaceae bacterium]